MNKQNFLTRMLLLFALIVGSVNGAWGAEGDSHDFTQTLSQLLNNGASIASIEIDAQPYPVKEVIISYTHNKQVSPFVTAEVSVGGSSWGSQNLTCNKTTTVSFSSASATGAITISFTNNISSGTGKGTFKVTNVRLIEGAVSLTKVATPSFSPSSSAVEAGTKVSINTLTDGATIYYTMGTNPADPTTSSSVYTGPITINEATTIKAIGIKDGMENSIVSSATYTIKKVVHGYTIDFEEDIDAYVDWTITNVGIHTSGVTSAHGGSAWGSNVNESGNGTETAIIQTNEKIAHPDVFTCYISKESNNTTASTWKIQVSSDGTSWDDIAELKSMTRNEWTEFSGDIKAEGYTDVYVRLYYHGSTAMRAVDDITLSEYDVVTVTEDGLATYVSDYNLDYRGKEISAYIAKEEAGKIKMYQVDKVPAGTGVLLKADGAATVDIPVTTEKTDDVTGNLFQCGEGKTVESGSGPYNYILNKIGGTVGFYRANNQKVDTNRAYLQTTIAPANGRLSIFFDDEEGEATGIIEVKDVKAADAIFNLNGVRVKNMTKGLYIVNGKKVIVK